MLSLCFAALSAAVLLGGLMLAGWLRRWAAVHGVIGVAGTVLLGLAIWWRATLQGAFAWDALVLAGLAMAGGLALAAWRGGRPGLLVFLHASAGGLAYLLLAGFILRR